MCTASTSRNQSPPSWHRTECKPPSPGYPHSDTNCVDLTGPDANTVCWCGGAQNCYQTETPQNNYIAIRNMPGSPMGDTLYAEYQSGAMNQSWTNMINIDFTKVDFVEYYNSAADKWQLNNLAKTAPKAQLDALSAKLHKFFECSGDECP